ASAIAKGTDGKVPYSVGFTNNFLIVPDDPAWLSFVQNVDDPQVIKHSSGSYYDGILSDSMGTAPVNSTYLNAKPVNPATGQLYNEAEWLQAEKAMLTAKKNGLPAG